MKIFGKRVRPRHLAVGLAAALLAAVLLTGCEEKRTLKEYEAQYLDCFDTITMVTVYTDSDEHFEELKEQIHSRLLAYHQMFDIYHSYEGVNNVKMINDNAGIQPIKVDQAIIGLLQFSRQKYEETDGMVNVAMGSVLSIWHDYREAGLQKPELAQLPDMDMLRQAEKHTDISQIQIDEAASTVYLPDSSMKLDLGAVAKGYAVEAVCGMLREEGVTSALVSAGGNVETIGKQPGGKPWRIGIKNPDNDSPQVYLHALELEDMSLVTSGVYQRFYEVGGVRYHHIINPVTLMPEREYLSVTILCGNSAVADALSTAVFNMPLEQGRAYIESLPDTEALWVLADGTEVMSSGMKDYLADQSGTIIP